MAVMEIVRADERLEVVLRAIREIAELDGVGPDEDIYDAGFASVRALDLLLELESAFGTTISDEAFIAARTPRDFCRLAGD